MNLPALTIDIKGEVVSNNLPDFRQSISGFLSTRVIDPQTDDDFVLLDEFIKDCASLEKLVAQSKSDTLSKSSDIFTLLGAFDEILTEVSSTRLTAEKILKAKKESIKAALIQSAKKAWADLMIELNKKTKPIKLELAPPAFEAAIKGKKNKDSCTKAIEELFEDHKEQALVMANDIVEKLDWCKENHHGYGFLFNDLQRLVFKDDDSFKEIINNRVTTYLEKKAIDDAKLLEAAQQAALTTKEPMMEPEPTKPTATVIPITKPVTTEPEPTDDELIEAIKKAYQVDRQTVVKWLFCMDYEKLAAEFLGEL